MENELLLFLNALDYQSSTNIINLTINNNINTNNIIIEKENSIDLLRLQSELNTAILAKKNLIDEIDDLTYTNNSLLDYVTSLENKLFELENKKQKE